LRVLRSDTVVGTVWNELRVDWVSCIGVRRYAVMTRLRGGDGVWGRETGAGWKFADAAPRKRRGGGEYLPGV